MRRGAGEAGQASVETVAIAPLVGLLLVALAVALAAHRAGEAAGQAAHAAGLAAMQGRDPREAAREAVPGLDADRLTVRVDGARIAVRVRAAGPRALVAPFDAERTVVARRAEN
ncbi:hypothetical protein [Patulibacter sp. SYSU D01012]|uniref:hypothetical protein n=1 Tax=Patulibacter sp. SYSU D01012 TaxID=2817381 RepID=UPI001B312069|nr:hypothetical protein [Patulibacter sp. SYSU D01012]